MNHNNCIFCKIIARSIPADIIVQTENVIVIKDLYPKFSIHYLIIPKKHIPNIQLLTPADHATMGEIIAMAQQLSLDLPQPKEFQLISNNGPSAGQVIFHIHFHFLAGKRLS